MRALTAARAILNRLKGSIIRKILDPDIEARDDTPECVLVQIVCLASVGVVVVDQDALPGTRET